VKSSLNTDISVVRLFFYCFGKYTSDILGGGDTSVPPRFTCEECSAMKESVEYEGAHGITYKIEE
jgi:hypothetical protein